MNFLLKNLQHTVKVFPVFKNAHSLLIKKTNVSL